MISVDTRDADGSGGEGEAEGVDAVDERAGVEGRTGGSVGDGAG